MSQIALYMPLPDDPMEFDNSRPRQPAGSFNTETSQFWQADDSTRPVHVPGHPDEEEVYVSNAGQRLWQTGDGRWCLTYPGERPAELLTAEQAEKWFAESGYSSTEDRDAFVRSGHLA